MVKRRFSQSELPAFDAPIASPEERRLAGKQRRSAVPRKAHAAWEPPADRRDPVEVLVESNRGRVPDLVPLRYARMSVSPFTFLRGSALIMAFDLASGPSTDLEVRLCGDAHLSNFGAFASPERRLMFDLNDFDEVSTGPFEWDVKRLAASIVVAGRGQRLRPARGTTGGARCGGRVPRLDGALRRHDPSRGLVRPDRDATTCSTPWSRHGAQGRGRARSWTRPAARTTSERPDQADVQSSTADARSSMIRRSSMHIGARHQA